MFSVQRRVFSGDDERLLNILAVHKSGAGLMQNSKHNKSKMNLLCLTQRKNGSIAIHKVREMNEKSGDVYTLRTSWGLDELKLVDGVSLKSDSKDFVLVCCPQSLGYSFSIIKLPRAFNFD